MAHFPDTPAFSGVLRPMRLEGDIFDLETEGEVPSQLNGTFHRVQSDRQLAPTHRDDQPFDGDGLVSLFRFQNGRVDFKQRFARTDRFKLEREAGRALFGAYRNPLTDDPGVKGAVRGTANANVIVHGGELYALKEDSPALLMDPLTLETKGYTDFGGKCSSQTFTAHPKIDPITGNMVAFSYASSGLLSRDCTFMEISATGELLKEVWFETPYYCMLHDFGVTEDYALFHVVPVVSSWERLEAGLPHFGFDTSLPVYLGVLPRDGQGGDMRWFKSPNLFCSHVMNAFNEGTRIHFDTPVAKNNGFPFFPDVHGAAFNPQDALSFLTRWTVDMNASGEDFEKTERLCDLAGEFPRIDDRYATQPHSYGWLLVGGDTGMPFGGPGHPSAPPASKIALIDFRNGRQSTWSCGPGAVIQEPCFVPRAPGSPEGEGYILAVVDDLVGNYSDLVILEALAVEEGPVARVKLPFRLRPGQHGNWADERKLSKS